jgi:hypothetical protein
MLSHREIANDLAKHRAIAGHHNQPSTRNARSIWAVAASTSLLFPVSAALRSNSAAKSQCGRPWRQDRSRPTKRAASSNVASSPPGRPVGSITRVSANLKFGACAMRALRPTRADDLKHRCTFLGRLRARLVPAEPLQGEDIHGQRPELLRCRKRWAARTPSSSAKPRH